MGAARLDNRLMAFRRMPRIGLALLTLAVATAMDPVASMGVAQEAGGPGSTTASSTDLVRRYADAASYQNNSAFDLAIVEWESLLKEFPNDPLVPKIQHYLAICYLRVDPPRLDQASKLLTESLPKGAPELREEALVHLGWSYWKGAQVKPGSGVSQPEADRKDSYALALDAFQRIGKEFPDGAYADRAAYYAADCLVRMEQKEEAAKRYREFLLVKRWEQSPLRPEVLFAMASLDDQAGRDPVALQGYRDFLTRYPKHPLVPEAQFRQAEIDFRNGRFAEASVVFERLVSEAEGPLRERALSRLGASLRKAGRWKASEEAYRRLLTEFPDSAQGPRAQLALALLEIRDGRDVQSKPRLEALVGRRDALAAEAAHWLIQMEMNQKQYGQAERLARETLAWSQKMAAHNSLQIDLADALMQQTGSWAEARTLYAAVVASGDPGLRPKALYQGALAAFQMGDLQASKELCNDFLAQHPDHSLASEVLLLSSESAMQGGQSDEAIGQLRALIEKDPKNESVDRWKLRLAGALNLKGSWEESLGILQSISGDRLDESGRVELLYWRASSLRRLGRSQESLSVLQPVVKQPGPFQEKGLYLLSQAADEARQPEVAQRSLEQLIEQYPSSRYFGVALVRLGRAASEQQQWDRAADFYQKLLQRQPEGELADLSRYGQAGLAMQQGKLDVAVGLLDSVARSPSLSKSLQGDVQMARGICLRQLGRVPEAIEALKQAKEVRKGDPKEAEAMMELGFTLASDGQPQPAQEVLLELRQAHPQYPSLDRVLYELAWTQKDLQETDRSMETFRELLQRFPESGFAAESNFHIGQAEYAREQFSKAITAYTAAWKGTSDSQLQEKALHKLGWSYFKQGEFSESERWFREQVMQFPQGDLQVDGLFMQAQCAAKAGRSPEAWKLYRAARSAIEGSVRPETIDEQIRTLVYLQGAQTARELKQWKEVEEWLEEIKQREGAAPFLPELLYELGYCYQNTGRPDEALQAYGQVAGRYRNETAARARFMMGEIFFAQKEYAKAIPEFQRVMFGFGGDSTDAAISDWQARSAIEAGRCAEAIAAASSDEGKQKAREMAAESYKYIVERHPKHEFAAQAKQRWDALTEAK